MTSALGRTFDIPTHVPPALVHDFDFLAPEVESDLAVARLRRKQRFSSRPIKFSARFSRSAASVRALTS